MGDEEIEFYYVGHMKCVVEKEEMVKKKIAETREYLRQIIKEETEKLQNSNSSQAETYGKELLKEEELKDDDIEKEVEKLEKEKEEDKKKKKKKKSKKTRKDNKNKSKTEEKEKEKEEEEKEEEKEEEEKEEKVDEKVKEEEKKKEMEEFKSMRDGLRSNLVQLRSQAKLFAFPPKHLIDDDKFILKFLRGKKFDSYRTARTIFDYWSFRANKLNATDDKITKNQVKQEYLKAGYACIPNITDKYVHEDRQ